MTQNFIKNSSLAFGLTILFLPVAFCYAKQFLPRLLKHIQADCCAVYPQMTVHFSKLNNPLTNAEGINWECQRAMALQKGIPFSFWIFAVVTASLVQGIVWAYSPSHWQNTLWLVVFYLLLSLIAYIDLLFHLVPTTLCQALWGLGVLGIALGDVRLTFADSLLSSFLGWASFYGVFYVSFRLYGREVFGRGDALLMFAIGGLFKWQILPKLVLIASLSALVWALLYWGGTKFLQKFQPTKNAFALSNFALPFVPFLAFATLVCDFLRQH